MRQPVPADLPLAVGIGDRLQQLVPHLLVHHADIRDDGDEVEVCARRAGGNIVEKLMKTFLAFRAVME